MEYNQDKLGNASFEGLFSLKESEQGSEKGRESLERFMFGMSPRKLTLEVK